MLYPREVMPVCAWSQVIKLVFLEWVPQGELGDEIVRVQEHVQITLQIVQRIRSKEFLEQNRHVGDDERTKELHGI
jgi:hypothetical protein